VYSKKDNAGLNISIPFGAIKSLSSHIIKELRIVISIPFGAIKSCRRLSCLFFQEISIPFGAIKRV